MQVLKNIGKVSFVILVIASVFVSLIYAYFYFLNNDNAVATNYIGNQIPVDYIEKIDDLSPEQISALEDRLLFEANYYSNKNNNGLELKELNLNYFTDYTLTTETCRSVGMQGFNSETVYNNPDLFPESFNGIAFSDSRDNLLSWLDLYYYFDTYDSVSWSGSTIQNSLNRDTSFIIKIDNEPYSIKLDGTYDYYTTEGILWWQKSVKHTADYQYHHLFQDIMRAVKTNSEGYGSYYITLDLSSYFKTIQKYNYETKLFEDLPKADIMKNYVTIKFHYYEDGAVKSSQSLFGSIACDSQYGEIDKEYWQEKVVYNFTEEDLDLRYSTTYNGYFASLNLDTINLFKEMPETEVNVLINLNSENLFNKKIVGLDFNAFENFDIETLSIIGTDTSFYFLEKSLYNTNLKVLQYSNGINLVFSDNAVNSAFEEVVL